ncbi:MAG: MFS transporter [Candidatus Freyarchaeota archaeon]|nr:MFS transporter [Candidatus Freyrarchaeum guaymaensis]
MGEAEYQVYRRRWAVLGSFCLVFFTAQLLWIEFATIPRTVAFAYGPFADQGLIALLTIEGPIVSTILSFPCGAVIDKWGWKKPVGVTAASLAVIGVLRAFAPDLVTLLISQILITTVGLFTFDAISKLTTQWFPFSEGATAQGIGTLSSFLGLMVPLFLSPVLVNVFGNPLLDPRGSLRDLSLAYGVFAVIVAIIFFAVAEEKPPKPPEPRVKEEEVPIRQGFSKILRVRQFQILSILFFGGFWVYLGLTTWIEMIVSSNAPALEKALEIYLAQAYPWLLPFIISQSQIQGGTVGALITLGGIIGCIILPSLSDKVNRRKPFIIVSVATVPPLVYLIGTTSGLVTAVAAFLLGFFLLACLPISFEIAMETREIGPKLAGLAVGGLYTFGNLGGSVGPLVVESLETSSIPYLMSQLYYWQCYIAMISQAWWLSMIPTAPLAFPGAFLTAIIATVIIGVIVFVASFLLKDTHAESQT